ncbi:M48 family metalloprotease [Blastomonas fulva]|uniref:M48 family metallopeptidase n=1 Tax=Blastomonas fulva TaxID=1550728 RepID=UPI003F70AD05
MITRAFLAACVALAWLAGAGQATAQPALVPPYTGAYQPVGVDEIGWWREMDEEEAILAQSDLVIREETLNGYLRKVLCDTVGSDRCNAVRIYIVRAPFFNASMTANGTMRVFTGLLLRVQNEAELGTVLGHEFGHFENRHILGKFKARRSGTDVLAWAAVLGSLAPSYDLVRTYRNLEFSIYGNLYRYGRDQEREADRLAIAYLNNSALRPQAASQMWDNLMAEAEASARGRGLKKPKFDAIAFAAALAQGGWTAQLHHARGELYRMRGAPRDLVNAAQFYADAIALDPAHAEANRGLGLSLLKTGQAGAGQAALQRYLDLKPDASDARLIRMMIPAGESQP